jgi:hypothetical protein
VVNLENLGNLPAEEWGIFMEECRRLNLRLPSSFPAVWSELYRSERCPYPINAWFSKFAWGAWEHSVKGAVPGALYSYDLISAYAWSGSMPMPDPRSFWATDRLLPGGIAICEFELEAGRHYPYPLKAGRNVAPITFEDCELLAIKKFRVIRGFRFDRQIDLRPHLDRVQGNFTLWKRILRCYWGRWASTAGPIQTSWRDGVGTPRKAPLPALCSNLLWAHSITARVKRRIWADTKGKIYHVFVDSVIVGDKLKTGKNVGDWKLTEVNRSGLVFIHPGAYKTPAGQWLKRSGIPAAQLTG